MMICDLKQKLMLMSFEDCMSNIKNLEGIIDFEGCLKKTSKFHYLDMLC